MQCQESVQITVDFFQQSFRNDLVIEHINTGGFIPWAACPIKRKKTGPDQNSDTGVFKLLLQAECTRRLRGPSGIKFGFEDLI
jgi:hypothetical protein